MRPIGPKNKIEPKDLDVASSGEATLTLKIKQIGQEILDRTVVSLTDMGNIVGFVTGKLYEAGRALVEMVFEGSKIEQINKQFEFLAKNAGASASILSGELVGATAGLADDTDVIKSASRALLLLDNSASKLPKIMEIATASSRLTGISVTESFDMITGAIASTSTRSLKNLMITIDQDSVYKEFARTLGISADRLTKNQEQQALLSAVIKEGNAGLVEAGKNADTVGESYTRLKVASAQLYEASAKGANKTFGGWFSSLMDSAAKSVQNVANAVGFDLGEGSDKAQSKIGMLTGQIEHLQNVNKKYHDEHGKDSVYITNKIAQLQAESTAIAKAEADKRNQIRSAESGKETETVQLTERQKSDIRMQAAALEASRVAADTQLKMDRAKAESALVYADADEKARIKAELAVSELTAQEAVLATKISQSKDFLEKEKLMKDKYALDAQMITAKKNVQDLENEKTKNAAMLQARSAALSQLASLQSLKNKELAGIGKAAAAAQITISTIEAAGHSFKWGTMLGGPVLGAIFSGLAYAAGAANLAKLSGVELAEGGIVLPRPGGTQATLGEAGQAEAVIPLDRAGEFGMGGGGITINVNGGLLGDQNQAREFALAIDRQLLELRRNNESVSFDGRVV